MEPQVATQSDIAGNPVAVGGEYRYWAFISYSHKDGAWAQKLHSGIETWPVPRKLVGRQTGVGAIPKKLFPVFRDRDEISAGSSLDEVIRAALKLSRYLIVICSPRSAASKYVNEEIRLFKAMGRESRIVYLIVEGEPGGDDSGDPVRGECFPPMARQAVAADGTCCEGDCEPIAADARAAKDGPRDAKLKVLARMLEVGFDELKRRDVRRRRRARLKGVAAAAIVLGLVALTYLGMADAGLRVPLGEAVRSRLDRHEWSVFRHVPRDTEIRAAAKALNRQIIDGLLKRRQVDGWFNDAPPGEPQIVGFWSTVQAVTPLLRRESDDGGPALAPLIESILVPFDPIVMKEHQVLKWGWHEADGRKETSSMMPLWTAIGLCATLSKPAARADPAQRNRLTECLGYTQEVLKLYHRDEDEGAWNAFPYQTRPELHSVYATAMALMALLEARSAGLPWDGSEQRRDELIRRAARWVMTQYLTAPRQHGWRNNPLEEHASDVFDGLTAQTYAALMQAEQAGVGVTLPPALREDIRAYLVGCGNRPIDYPVDVGEMRVEYRHLDGSKSIDRLSLRYLWWPWSIRSADLWLRYAEQHHLPMEQRVQVRRALAHLVITLGPQEVSKALAGYSYILAEDLYGIEGLARD